MKELSIEEKAKAYDEAKLRMSAAYNSNRCTIGFMNEIFPELEESEDEKIKKSINRLIRYYHDVNFPTPEGFSRKDLLDWIEKRGEQESANWLQELEDKLANATPKQLAEWKEKYFKEEPAEWSEEDEINRDLLYNALNKVYDIEHNVALSNWINKRILLSSKQEWSVEDKMQLDAAIHLVSRTGHIETTNWLMSLKYRVQPQPKQEWSKEDEDILNTIINHFKIDIECTDEDDVIRWLKSLRPQNWTKEDKERYKSCLQRLSTGNPEQPETINSKWFKEHVYPKPQSTWRPSDRQIEILKDFLFHIPKEVPEKVVLVSLYHDLLKLKG